MARLESEDLLAMRALANGDVRGLDHLVHRYRDACVQHAFSIIDDHALAEDVVQEAFVDLWRTAGSFEVSRSSVRGWLHVLVQRRAIDTLRRRSRRSLLTLDAAAARLDDTQSPATQAVVACLAETAVRALECLAESRRRAIVLAYWGGYTMREIADLEALPVGTVKSHCREALIALRRDMNVDPTEHLDLDEQ